MDDGTTAVLGCVGILALLVVIDGLMAWAVMALWNWLMPYLFNLPEINFWMALGILILANFIFGAGRRSSSK